MKALCHATQVRCPEEHPFRTVELRWESDGQLTVICKSGTGPYRHPHRRYGEPPAGSASGQSS